MMETNHSDKLQELKKKLAEKDKVLISFSGGVDSSLLAKVASDLLGENALCVILDTETLARRELEHARDVAKELGINCQIVSFSILDDPEFIKNLPTRCYLCKKKSARMLQRVAKDNGISCIADGVNTSDCSDYRPGILASNEEGIWHPFVDAAISKEEIREIARLMGLPFWNKPSSACLASRIPYGELIAKETLEMAEKAEDCLKSLDLSQVRVRVHGQMARVEVLDRDMEIAFHFREIIVKELKEIGFKYIALDLQGFRSGSMNEVLMRSQ